MFADEVDLLDRLQLAADGMSDEEMAAVALALELASGFIEDYIPGGVLEHTDAEYSWDTSVEGTTRVVPLPHHPKVPVTVTKVTVDGDDLEAEEWRVDRLHGVRRADGGSWVGLIEITYDYGFADPPNSLRGVCLDLAARQYGNPESVLQARMGSDRSVSFADSSEAATGLGAANKAILESFKPVAL